MTLNEDEWRKKIVLQEWIQFQEVQNIDGRAECQDNWPTFWRMRAAQFASWKPLLLASYTADLDRAQRQGRNLIAEKYGRMMADTDPDYYREHVEPHLLPLDPDRVSRQEQIIQSQIVWAVDFARQMPEISRQMRPIRSKNDTAANTSMETYLRGELSTYSQSTLQQYESFICELLGAGRNLTAETVRHAAELEAADPPPRPQGS